MQNPHVRELAERLNNNQVILFVGDALSEEPALSARLTSALVDACGHCCPFCEGQGHCSRPTSCVRNLTQSAQRFQNVFNPHALRSFVQQFVATTAPSAIHHAIAQLPVRVIFTTAYDDHLLDALKQAGRSVNHIVSDAHLPYDDSTSVQLIRLHGSVSRPESLLLTDEDTADLFRRLPLASVVLRAYLATKTPLFLGYRLDETDPFFLALYRQTIAAVDTNNRLGYAALPACTTTTQRRWSEKIHIFDCSPAEVVDLLPKIVVPHSEPAPASAARPQHRRPTRPYKFLDYFEGADADIFHGRDTDADRLLSWVLTYPFCILYGESGIGKTSLIQAAIQPKLEVEGYQVVYVRPFDNLWQQLYIMLASALGAHDREPQPAASLRDLASAYLPADRRIVLVIDQFEEFFIRQGDASQHYLIGELADLLHVAGGRIRCLLSLRSDYLHYLDAFEPAIGRDPLQRRVRLYNLGPQSATTAIVAPANHSGFEIEGALVERLLSDLDQGGVAPPQLQIVCYRLWDDWRQRGEPYEGLTLERYDQLGGTNQILANYLDSVIDGLAEADMFEDIPEWSGDLSAPDIARIILKSMVTADRTKSTLSLDELARHPFITRHELETRHVNAVLHHLQDQRVVRKLIERESRSLTVVARYELAHEVMIHKVWEWFTIEERQLLDLRDLLLRATSDYRKFGALLPLDRYSLFLEGAASIQPDEAALRLLLESAIEYELAPERWVQQMDPHDAVDMLARLLDRQKRTRYVIIARALGYTRSTRAIRYLEEFLRDRRDPVQRAAIEGLVHLGLPQVVRPLFYAVQRETALPRVAPILEALEQLRTEEAIGFLTIIAGSHPNRHASNRAAQTLVRLKGAKNIRSLITLIELDDSPMRKDTVNSIVALLMKNRVEFAALLEDRSPQIWEATLRMLRAAERRPALELLLVALQDDKTLVRQSAAEALGELADPRAVEPLLAVLDDEDAAVQSAAAKALGELADPRAVEPLLAALHDPVPLVRQAAAKALGELADPRAVEPLQAALQDEDAAVQSAAAEALGELADPRATESSVVTLEEVPFRLVTAGAPGQVVDLRTVEAMLEALQNESPSVRQTAARALGEQADLRAVEPLQAAMRDDNPSVRSAAARALGQLADPRAVEPLMAALQEQNTNVRSAAAKALGQLADPRAVEPLLAALHDPVPLVRQIVMRALGQLADPRAVEPLLAALHDPEPLVRQFAVKGLSQLADPRAVEPLLAALHDEDTSVRFAVVEALGQLADPRAVEPLLAALQDKVPLVQQAAAKGLGQLADPRAVEPLLAALNDNDPIVRSAVIEALSQLADPRAVEPVLAALQDEYLGVRFAAVEALGKLADPRAVEPLQAALQNDSSGIQQAAKQVLERLGGHPARG